MNTLRDFLSHPLSFIRQWAAANERALALYLPWILAVVFLVISVYYLVKSLSLV